MEKLIYLVIILIIVLCIYYRKTKYVISLVGNTIVDIEQEFNSKSGQDKLEEAVKRIRGKLPLPLSVLITKARLIDIIEFIFSIVNKAFNIEREFDIKGNERDFKINIDSKKSDISYTVEHKPNYDDSFILYGKLKADTDFRGHNNASVEIGFEKKL